MNQEDILNILEEILALSLNDKEAYELFQKHPYLWNNIAKAVLDLKKGEVDETKNC